MSTIAKLKELVASAEVDAAKFYEKGNSAAGTRLRKALQEIKVTAQEIRQDVSSKKRA
ncbi:hypothetical protein [Mucilaginibacter paludis]|uniref:Histone H1 n=1 Tax=Mucilaginibacter paludis DSM 18603 TaxID=714943 RepID=H1XZ77_9SPHI|nr:hypothetical protein [Mucilaginibacter paludis]EHQ24662.1 hypothetical protein Mucpa_0468 [Mucilaginibacter paludis DSM 18603]